MSPPTRLVTSQVTWRERVLLGTMLVGARENVFVHRETSLAVLENRLSIPIPIVDLVRHLVPVRNINRD